MAATPFPQEGEFLEQRVLALAPDHSSPASVRTSQQWLGAALGLRIKGDKAVFMTSGRKHRGLGG